ncbi:MAG: YceI family protein [Bacteroidia bacterium]|nr:YceI family protein [Bacteroidia bacterium]MDW8133742.1 YceI family protein [Bacteroidia bacterium]
MLGRVSPYCILYLIKLSAQSYHTDSLTISFYSDAPLEKISAENRTGCYSWIDFQTDSVFVKVKIRGFSFPNKLMEEHFNEDYLESEKYPYAYFQGKLVSSFPFQQVGTYAVSAEGTMEIHGVKKRQVLAGIFEVLPTGKLLLQGKFIVRLEDYKIRIPRLLWNKIAEEVEVSFRGIYRPERSGKK